MRERLPVSKAFFGSANLTALIAKAAIAGFCVVVADSAAPENWVDIPNSSATALAVDADSVSPVEGLPYTVGAWFRYTYNLSIDCSPPRGCLAASQRIYYRVDCPLKAITPIQRISLDLNGNVTKPDAGFNAASYLPSLGSLESLAIRSLCFDYRLRYAWPPIGWPASMPPVQPVPLPSD